MDVKVQGKGMVGVGRHHAFKAGDHRLSIRLRFTARAPIVPGHRVHQCFCID